MAVGELDARIAAVISCTSSATMAAQERSGASTRSKKELHASSASDASIRGCAVSFDLVARFPRKQSSRNRWVSRRPEALSGGDEPLVQGDEPLVQGDEPLVQGPGQVPRRASRRSERAGSMGAAGALQAP